MVSNFLSWKLIILRTLELHGAEATVLQKVVRTKSHLAVKAKTHAKQEPLKHLTVVCRLFLRINP